MTETQKVIAFGPVEEAARQQLDRCIERGGEEARGVLCADHHKGYSMPIGGVLASQTVVMPAGVGYDIACGNCAVQTDVKASDVDVPRIMDEIWRVLSFGVGQKNEERIDEHPVLDAIFNSPVEQQRSMWQMARNQLGTIGSGNHYVDLFEDREDGLLWVGVHFGSRGFGHKTACGFLALANGKAWGEHVDDSMDAPPVTIPLGTPLADAYLAGMEIAGQYAYAGRNWVVDRVLRILAAKDLFRVHNHHNFAWWEHHDGARWLVVRKGATPAFPGQLGFVGGSMGDDAVIVRGKESPVAATAFYSTVHGAGRVMGRKQAAGVTKVRKRWECGMRDCDGWLQSGTSGPGGANPKCPKCGSKTHKREFREIARAGVVDWPAWQAQLKAQGVELRGGGADEAPQCYKRLSEVLAYHRDTIDVLHTLRPIGVAMAGAETFDPYKD